MGAKQKKSYTVFVDLEMFLFLLFILIKKISWDLAGKRLGGEEVVRISGRGRGIQM